MYFIICKEYITYKLQNKCAPYLKNLIIYIKKKYYKGVKNSKKKSYNLKKISLHL